MNRCCGAVLVAVLLPMNAGAEPLKDLSRSIAREGARLASGRATAERAQPPVVPDRSWAGRHPVALGAVTGAAAGGIWGYAQCAGRPPCGDGHDVLLFWFGTGVGAAISSGVGALIGAATRP